MRSPRLSCLLLLTLAACSASVESPRPATGGAAGDPGATAGPPATSARVHPPSELQPARFHHTVAQDDGDGEPRIIPLHSGALDEAVAAWRQSLREDRFAGDEGSANRAAVHGRLATALALLGDTEEARGHLREARRLGGRTAAALEPLLDGRGLAVTTVSAGGGTAPAAPLLLPPVRLDRGAAGAQAAEPAVAAGPDGEVVAAWIESDPAVLGGAWRIHAAVSLDSGDSWHPLGVVHPPGEDDAERFDGDPTVTRDPESGDFWIGGTSFFTAHNLYSVRKPAGRLEMDPPVLLYPESNARPLDHGSLAAGAGAGEETLLYMAENGGLQVSRDRGLTWSEPLDFPGLLGPVARVDTLGEVAVVGLGPRTEYLLRSTRDGGRTLRPTRPVARRLDVWPNVETDRVPGVFRVAPLATPAVDPTDGTLFVLYSDTAAITSTFDGRQFDLDLFLTRSHDGGVTWSPPRRLEIGAAEGVNGNGDQFHPWLEVDRQGRLHTIFFDTRRTPQEDGDATAWVDVVYAWSLDGGATWAEVFLTDQPYSTDDARWGTLQGGEQFLGDYLGLAVAGQRAYAVYPAVQGGDLDVFVRPLDLSPLPPPDCTPRPHSLCLLDGRFRASVRWRDFQDGEGPGRAAPFSFADDSGTFWFFDPGNVELVVKALDGRAVNDHFWFFYGALSNVGYDVRLSDLHTGHWRTYRNPVGNPCGQGDTTAFPGDGSPPAETLTVTDATASAAVLPAAAGGSARGPRIAELRNVEPCRQSDTALCLTDERFEVSVTWRDPRTGETGVGHAIPGTSDSGFFWFFDPANVELVVKLLDAREINPWFWFFWGGLSDVEYTISVRDTRRGFTRTWSNEAFQLCGGIDTGAFSSRSD